MSGGQPSNEPGWAAPHGSISIFIAESMIVNALRDEGGLLERVFQDFGDMPRMIQ